MPLDFAQYGLDRNIAVAGFFGGVCALYFVENIKPLRALLALFMGAAAANYLNALVVVLASKFYAVAGPIQLSLAFAIGFCAPYILGGIRNLARRWEKNPQLLLSNSTNSHPPLTGDPSNANDPHP